GHAGDQPAGRGGEVDVAGLDGGEGGVGVVEDVDERLQLGEPPVEAGRVVRDDAVDAAGAQVIEEPLVGGPAFLAERADVVVGVDVGDGPAAGVGEGAAVGFLAGDAEAGAFPVVGDAGVDSHVAHKGHTTTAPCGTVDVCPSVAPRCGS